MLPNDKRYIYDLYNNLKTKQNIVDKAVSENKSNQYLQGYKALLDEIVDDLEKNENVIHINDKVNNLSSLRQSCGITQKEAAKYLGCSFQHVSRWENTQTPNSYTVYRMSKLYNRSADEILEFLFKK